MTVKTSVRALAGLAWALSATGLTLTLANSAAAVQLGGYRTISTDDAGVQAAAEFAAGAVGGSLQSVDSAQAQSVAGTNYRLTITLESGAVWQVVVYRNTQGEHSLTSSTQTSEGEVDTGTNDGSDHSGDDD